MLRDSHQKGSSAKPQKSNLQVLDSYVDLLFSYVSTGDAAVINKTDAQQRSEAVQQAEMVQGAEVSGKSKSIFVERGASTLENAVAKDLNKKSTPSARMPIATIKFYEAEQAKRELVEAAKKAEAKKSLLRSNEKHTVQWPLYSKPSWQAGKPKWATKEMNCQLLKVNGMIVAIPKRMLLPAINVPRNLAIPESRLDWYDGYVPDGQFRHVLNAGTWIVGSEGDADLLIPCQNYAWALSVEEVLGVEVVAEADISWRGDNSKRLWLAGIVKSKKWVLLDLDMLIYQASHKVYQYYF